MVPNAHLARWAMVPLLGMVLALAGCSRGPATAEAALYDYVAAVNARDRGALEALAAPVYEPSEFADWVLLHAPAGQMEVYSYKIENPGFPEVSYGYVKWQRNGGVPKDGRFVFGREDLPDGSWSVGFLNEGPDERRSPSAQPTPKVTPSATRK